MNLFDTAEMYGSGRCETALGKTLEGIPRDRLFLVDKIHPDHTAPASFARSLDHSLIRLDTDYIDLYLLHWRENVDLPFLVDAMHEAQRQGKIRHWGVSNFTIEDMKDLFAAGGTDCFCDQIFYTLYERGAEYDLVPFLKEHDILPMSYSSLGSDCYPHPDIHQHPEIMALCRAEKVPPEAMMLRWNAEQGFCTLFSTSSLPHLRDNLQEVPEEAFRRFQLLVERDFPAPAEGYPLVKI
jgi:diketogulonate reductase-like aldo/keto reductase